MMLQNLKCLRSFSLDILWAKMLGIDDDDDEHEHERVVVFVLFVSKDEKTSVSSHMEFYAFHESLFCPIGDQHWMPHADRPLKDVSFSALPFMVINSCPIGCSFVSVEDRFYLTGGTTLSYHQMKRKQLGMDVDEIAKKEYLDMQEFDVDEPTDGLSKRVKCFQLQEFINSLGDKQMGISQSVELDEVSNDSPIYWKTCPSMSIGRAEGHLLHLSGKLYAIGRPFGDHGGPSIEVFDLAQGGVWTRLAIKNPPDIDPCVFMSAAMEGSKTILIGSNNSFYGVDVGNGQAEAHWKKIEGLDCPSNLIYGCLMEPGFAFGKCFVLWHDTMCSCIRGVSFFKKHPRHFTVDLLEEVHVNADETYISRAKLIDLGNDTLGLIYAGNIRQVALDESREVYCLCEYHYTTFAINFNSPYLISDESVPFPGVQLKTRLISRRKCYAPYGSDLGAAFAMDAHFPH